MKRNIFNTTTTCEKVDLAGFTDDLPNWLTQQMSNKALTYLLPMLKTESSGAGSTREG